MRKISKLIIHCSASEMLGDANSIRILHVKQNGWKDIGYHYVIKRDGIVEKGRHEDIVGAHCEGHNSNSIGICLCGVKHFDYAQLSALRDLCRDILNRYNLTYRDVYAHYEFDKKGKTCPNIDAMVLRAFIKE